MSADPTFELEGEGYALVIPDAATAARDELIAAASVVTRVASNEESALAQREIRNLAGLRIAVENARKKVKAPVIELGKKIDAAAADFIAGAVAEEKRLTLMVGKHAEEVAQARREAEREERRKAEEARRAAEEAERAKREEEEARRKAEEAVSIREKLSAKAAARQAEAERQRAEEERLAALNERRDASANVISTRVNDGVRFADDFEVVDIAALYAARPDLVSLSAKTSEVKRVIKEMRDAGEDPELPGLRIFRKPVVSTR